MMRIGSYVAEDMERALSEPRESTVFFYERMQRPAAQTPGSWVDEQNPRVAQSLADPTYESVLQDRLVYGTPETVADRLQAIIDELGLSGVIMIPNVGGRIPRDHLSNSIRLFGQEVAPRLVH